MRENYTGVGDLESYLLAKKNDNLSELVRYLQNNVRMNDKEILAFAQTLVKASKLISQINVLKYGDIVGKITSALVIAVFSETSATSAAFLSSATYFLANKIAIMFSNIGLQEEVIQDAIGNIVCSTLCKGFLEQIIVASATITGRDSKVVSIINAMKKNLELMEKDLNYPNLFHIGSMCGIFIGATLGADLGFGWLGRSMLNLTTSWVAGRCCHAFWNADPPGSAEEQQRPRLPMPVL